MSGMEKEPVERLLRNLPAVGKFLEDAQTTELIQRFSRREVVQTFQELMEELREEIRQGRLGADEIPKRVRNIMQAVRHRLHERARPSLRRVVNATGILLLTNAGRAPLAEPVFEAMREPVCRYSNLEYDLTLGRRGHRDIHVEGRLRRLLGCEAATVVNNAAAALVLILNTLARNRDVLVSRGELIEIGGSFRLPEIMQAGGAFLKEVGTTNRTRTADFADAVDENTAVILRVHPSNYRIVGFTESPPLAELVEMAHRRRLPLVYDVGSGLLFPDAHSALREEPAISDCLAQGVDLVCSSGDKLLGGPQAGLIVGRHDLVEKIRRNPLMRAMRVDKMVYAALDATLLQYAAGRHRSVLPVWSMLQISDEEIRRRVEAVQQRCSGGNLIVEIEPGYSYLGGGSAPGEGIPTWLLALQSTRLSARSIEEALRRHTPPILTRIEKERVLLDLRTVFPDEDEILASGLLGLAKSGFAEAHESSS